VAAGVIATVVCGLAVAALLLAEWRGSRRARVISKPIASAGFVAIPLVTGALHADDPRHLALLITIGLGLGAIGDVALLAESDRGLLVGLVAFLLGHVAYVVAFARIVPIDHWLDGAMAAGVVVPVGFAALILGRLWPRLGALRAPVIAYVGVITTMLIGGLAVSVQASRPMLLTAGAVAFFLSDLAVARERFVVRDKRNRYLGLPVYYGAQVMMAWAIS
jgi:uncharacterized membrane protein YhhN